MGIDEMGIDEVGRYHIYIYNFDCCVFVCLFVCPDSDCNTMNAFIVEINFDIVVSYKLKY